MHPTPDPVGDAPSPTPAGAALALGDRRPLVGVAAAVAAAALWGGGTVATHWVLGLGIPATAFTGIELTSSVVFLVIVCLISGTTIPSPRRSWRAGWIGLLEPGAVYLIMNLGLAHTSATHASLITALQPVLIVLFGWLAFRHAVPARLWIPMALVLLGTATVITANGSAAGSTRFGDALVLLGTVVAAVYVLAASRVAAHLAPLALTLLQQVFALLLVLPVVAVSLLADGIGPGPAHAADWLYVPLIGIATSALTFWLYLTALRHLSAGSAGQFLAVIPLVGFAGSVLVLGEPAGAQAFLGAAVVGGALVAVARLEHQQHQAEQEAEAARAAR